MAEKLNMKLPIESHVLQACVSEPVKPFLDHVVTFGAGHFYCSQSDKGEMVMGGDWTVIIATLKGEIFQRCNMFYQKELLCFQI